MFLVLNAISDKRSTDTNQTARRRIGDQAPIERNGGAKPRLLVENAANTELPFSNTSKTATVRSKKRLLDEWKHLGGREGKMALQKQISYRHAATMSWLSLITAVAAGFPWDPHSRQGFGHGPYLCDLNYVIVDWRMCFGIYTLDSQKLSIILPLTRSSGPSNLVAW
jgi:hypothetical protein